MNWRGKLDSIPNEHSSLSSEWNCNHNEVNFLWGKKTYAIVRWDNFSHANSNMHLVKSRVSLSANNIRTIIEINIKLFDCKAWSMRKTYMWKKKVLQYFHDDITITYLIYPKTWFRLSPLALMFFHLLSAQMVSTQQRLLARSLGDVCDARKRGIEVDISKIRVEIVNHPLFSLSISTEENAQDWRPTDMSTSTER